MGRTQRKQAEPIAGNLQIPQRPRRKRLCIGSTSTDSITSPVTTPRPRGITVTPSQLRHLWLYDNRCARKYMKGPLRSCSMLEAAELDETGDEDIQKWKDEIKAMWQNAGQDFEIYIDDAERVKPKEKRKGYGLRVKMNANLKKYIHPKDAVTFGWIANIPLCMPLGGWAHVFNRSSIKPKPNETHKHLEYLGGPISFLNFCRTSSMKVVVTSGRDHQICRMHFKGEFTPGSELLWNYGFGSDNATMPSQEPWFLPECCKETFNLPEEDKRHDHKVTFRDWWFQETCVLCGQAYSMKNKDNRVQRKPHLVGSHADYLGTVGDGCDNYVNQEVDSEKVLFMAEKLNQLLLTLKSMNWSVTPACKVFSKQELMTFANSPDSLLEEFIRRKEMLEKHGVIILRGFAVPSKMHHFIPISPRNWKAITWKDHTKPNPGRCGVPGSVKEEIEKLIPSLVAECLGKEIP